MFFSDNGQGKETRFNENAEVGPNIDLLMGTVDAAKSASSVSIKGMLDLLDFGNNSVQIASSLQGARKEIFQPKAEAVDSLCDVCKQAPHPGETYTTFDKDNKPIETGKTLKK